MHDGGAAEVSDSRMGRVWAPQLLGQMSAVPTELRRVSNDVFRSSSRAEASTDDHNILGIRVGTLRDKYCTASPWQVGSYYPQDD